MKAYLITVFYAMKDHSTSNLTRKTLSQRWEISVVTIKRWEKSNRLRPVRLGPRTIRYPLAYIEQLESQGIAD